MSTLSVCVIAKNEENVLNQCLSSIADFADEIIFVDTGSTDSTVEIAKKFTKNIFSFPWIDDFSAAYNFALSKATMEYSCRWDADFVLTSESFTSFQNLKRRNFDDKNIIHFTWNIEANHGVRTRKVMRAFITKTGTFHFLYPIHAHFVPNTGVKVLEGFYHDISVDHIKDKELKKHRYTQTQKILDKILLLYPHDPYLLFQNAEGLIYAEEFHKAINFLLQYLKYEDISHEEKRMIAIEKIVACYLNTAQYDQARSFINEYIHYSKFPRFLLMQADVTAIFNFTAAETLYSKYLKIKFDPKDTVYSYDYYRYQVHPYVMLFKISILQNDYSSAKKYLKNINFSLCTDSVIAEIRILENKLK